MQDSNRSEDSVAETQGLTVEQAIANLRSPDLSLRYYAAWWLGKFRVNAPRAVEALIAALEDEDDRTELGGYPLRRNAARALGKLGDTQAVPGLIRCLACEDYYVREAAAQSLGMLDAPSAIPTLMELLTGGVEVAVPVPGRPHLTQPYDSVIEALGALQAKQAVSLIQPFLEHPQAKVQYAATRAMYQLTQEDRYGQRLMQALEGDDLQLRRTALSDLGAIGYFPAREAIARCAAENSFKLLALKGLLEHQAKQHETPTQDAIQVMNLMDSLL
ncbi:PBS lyase HEAT domain protein repeat-containing protein [Gloeocapsa sp. PCC 7428]|uniref:HEAT repeat domain-containing protein n=1 Tax=Gloeocapsa sp. PCC 7428 TaxID=1173026 RepID=UPI0002A5F0A7|nr:HEAT repeat domain-containing protein [Gloeocapsa sp. PCC 7428]AFZ33038.1 PBS lyase HEAT domain protein repeat-containing protein [Gloeocapsa sp. PCC 7428]